MMRNLALAALAALSLGGSALAAPSTQNRGSYDPVTDSTRTSHIGAASTDASGTVTLGGTYQTVFAANIYRKGCLIQNPTTATEILSVKVGTMANPITIPIGGSFNCAAPGGVVVTDAITVTAATTTHAFAAVSQ